MGILSAAGVSTLVLFSSALTLLRSNVVGIGMLVLTCSDFLNLLSLG